MSRLRKHVEILASPEFGGRRGPVVGKTRDYLVARFRDLKLEPLFEGSFFQNVPDKEGNPAGGRNIGAKIVGSDPKLKDEWIIVGAHYDHLGGRGEVYFPGADDNASGVAMMLEVARSLATAPERPKRSVMLVGFDLEEIGLWGSRYFAEHSPVPLAKVKLFITADMIARSLGGVFPKHVFVMGTESGPWLRPILEASADPERLKLGILGADILLVDRSDYGPFRSRKIPFLFFSTGENPHYHRTTDRAETLDYSKLEAVSRVIHTAVRAATDRPEIPGWNVAVEPSLSEAGTLREVFQGLLDHREKLEIGSAQIFMLRNSIRSLDRILARKEFAPAERASILRVAQVILATVF